MPGREVIIGISPFHRADAKLVAALCKAGALGVLDLSGGGVEELQALARQTKTNFGVRIDERGRFDPADLPPEADVIILPAGVDPAPWQPRRILVQVTSAAEAEAAVHAGVSGLIAKGSESGGRVGDESAFVLLQRLVRTFDLPVWVQGGIGLHTAAASMVGGAAGVVLDSQLALVRESQLPAAVKDAIGSMDGSETRVVAGYRIFTRPDLPAAKLENDTADEVVARLGASDLTRDLLPVGQDGAFARPLAERFQTAGGVVRAIRDAISDHTRLAQIANPLAPGVGLAAEHGIRYPIVQGPMTRVSDQPAFAAAVVRGGGLPFLALALMRGLPLRDCLAETAERLKGQPWGVGILGFVAPEIREEQLAAIQEVAPPVALIAGGRPSQARSLEAAGIPTYLHVPSPGLLDLFLNEGARRFVFEGSECGGHVGPRTSFALWELQLGRLLAFDHPEQLSVLFAGGIHDARSAAMVAAMAAPLAARGARIGVLMGTAYIFTHEAVECGAILPTFQRTAVDCAATALLETAPGHATRCVETAYVRAFRAEKQRLEAEGLDQKQVWAALEELNLGRLRIATKGLRRDGDGLVDVDEDTQRREGMFMIGQVAALRRDIRTIAELHQDVSEGSTEYLRGVCLSDAGARDPVPADVAIIGMSCIFPGAPDLDSFWSNIVNGVNSITEVPKERWHADIYYDPKAPPGRKTPSKWGGFVPETSFDPVAFGIPPKSLAAIEPVQILSLQVAQRALADAGYAERDFDRERTSVIIGAACGTDLKGAYNFRALYPQYLGPIPEALDKRLPTLTEDSFPGVLANVIAGRIANRLDLGGVNYTVDAACASSLAAVDAACKELAVGISDMVLCGGADLHNTIEDYLSFSSVRALSPSGQCRTFDAAADGIALGEGIAVIVMKRVADAERDGDRIYAVIEGVGGSSDGRCLGLTAPRQEGQVRALARAYRSAGVSPADVTLVEAHGTGTVVGDATELATLNQVFAGAGAIPGSCVLGSVKSQIGHTKCAAGLAGLIKVALSLYHSVLPPTLNIRRPNPSYNPATSPFLFLDAARPWRSGRRVAGVNSFGFGGTNFHVVLRAPQGAEPPASGLPAWPYELFLFRGTDPQAALEHVYRLEELVRGGEPYRLRDVACSVAAAGEGLVQIAVVAGDMEDLRAKLGKAHSLSPDPAGVFISRGSREPVAFLFPGQGSQRPGMLANLFVAFPGLQRLLELGAGWYTSIFPGTAFTPEEEASQAAALKETRVAQPALGIADLAVADLLSACGVRADMAAGHSYGELAALCFAGAFSEMELLRLSGVRAQCIVDAAGEDPGTMAAASCSAANIGRALDGLDRVVLANYNGPDQIVISGPTKGVEAAVERLRLAGVTARVLPVGCGFHSPVVAGAQEGFRRELARTAIGNRRIPVWANSTAAVYPEDPEAVRDRLAEQIAVPVRFTEQIEGMYAAGARIFVEVGPGAVLTGLVRRILGQRSHTAVACDTGRKSGLREFLLALGELAVHGVPVDVAPLFAGRGARPFDLRTPPRVAPPPTSWLVNGHLARPLQGELPDFAMRPATDPLPITPGGDGNAVVLEYFRSMRHMVEQQRDVMLQYLGGSETHARSQPDRPVAMPTRPQPVVEPTPEPTPPSPDVAAELLAIVSERTGYPVEMLNLDFDMEADLSIDSIKRVEIIGDVILRLGFSNLGEADRDKFAEQLTRLKTLRAIIDWLRSLASLSGEQPKSSIHSPAVDTPTRQARFVLSVERTPAAQPNGMVLQGRRFLLTEDRLGVAARLAAQLHQRGAESRLIEPGASIEKADALIHLGSLTPDCDTVGGLFASAQQFVRLGGSSVLAATGLGGNFGRDGRQQLPFAGVSGFIKSLARECPSVRARVVDLDPTEDPDLLAKNLFAELLAGDDLVEVGYTGTARQVLRVSRRALPDGSGEPALKLGPDSVVLVTGGARGITSHVASALARRFHCRLELVGRSRLPASQEDPDLAGAVDLPQLRQALLARGGVARPADVESAARRMLADREIRRTMATIEEAPASVSYHAVDVRDPQAFAALIDDLYGRYGRIDGVVHGAGIIEDKLLAEKTQESFHRVFDTKVRGALTLAQKLRDDVQFVVFFSSIAGVFGNRGQTDYAAASEALDKIAFGLQGRLPGRVVSIDWGPWEGTGMVSPELQREYARRGVDLISPSEGVDAFFAELACRDRSEAQVVWMKAGDGMR